ncbi:hypothetical protein [Halegenticoccus soli]|uniref:hypothetical protein n=1 Tax=Halegenticoccus soli TaxID=1985678 RepID=UPI000C6DCE49|nr:hypothetical protein [Halegenticoccus soli]
MKSAPTTLSDWRTIARAARLVLSTPAYALLAVVAALVGLTTFVVSQNLSIVRDLVLLGPLPLAARFAILVNLFPVVGSGFGVGGGALLAVASVLIGVNTAMLAYHLRNNGGSLLESSGSVGGVVLSTMGAGCAACGSALVAGILGLFGATGLLALFPLHGLEFVVLAIVALVLSTFWLAEGMRGGDAAGCPVEFTS